MVPKKKRAMAALLAIFGLAAMAGPAAARNWVTTGWAKVPVRAYASAAAPTVGIVDGGIRVELTGQCTRDLDLKAIAYMSGFRQRLIVAKRWCEVAAPVHGWIFGGFLKPW